MRPGDALDDDAGIGIEKDAHDAGPSGNLGCLGRPPHRDRTFGGLGERLGGDDVEPRVGQNLAAFLDVGAGQADDQRHADR